MYDISAIKQRISCVEVAQHCGLDIQKSGDRCVSPLRPGADNPTSFLVDDERWYDFGDGNSGDGIDLLAEIKHNGNRGRAIRELAELTGVEGDGDPDAWLEYTNQLNHRTAFYNKALTEEDRGYLHARGLTDEDIKRLMIGRVTDGYLKGRLFLPYFKNGAVVYYATRAMSGGALPESKYMKQKSDEHCQHIPWGMQTLNRAGETLIIAEGYFDAVSFECKGYPVISAITGRFSKSQLPTVISIARRFKRVFMVYDNDERSHAGEKFTSSMAELLAKNEIPFIVGKVPAPYKDVSEYYAAGGDLQNLLDKAVDDVDFMPRIVFDKLGAPEMYTGQWTLSKDGVSCEVVINKKTGEKDTVHVTSTPIVPICHLENQDTGCNKLELAFMVGESRRTVILDREVVANKSKIVSLANFGVDVTTSNAGQLVNYLADIQRWNMAKIPREKSISHLGWAGEKFLPYDEDIRFDGETGSRKLYRAVAPKGDAKAWSDYVFKLRKNRALRLTMAASFASPLIGKCDALPFVYHLWGRTGSGKSVALKVAASIWGKPELGDLVFTLNFTDNALMHLASTLYSLPFLGDELQLIKSEYGYDRLIMRLTEGLERGRLSSTATMGDLREWKNSFIFSGEEPISADNSGGGVKNRLVEVNTDDGVVDDGREAAMFVNENYGHAGRTFIDYVKTQDVKARYKEIFRTVDGVTAKQAMAATLLLLGDSLARECLFPYERPYVWSDIEDLFLDAEEVSVSERAMEFTRGWIVQNKKYFMRDSTVECWGVMENSSYGESVVFVLDHVLVKALAAQGFSFDAVKRDWAERGFLRKYRDNRFKARKSINGDKPYCYQLGLQTFSDVGEM